MDGAPWRRVGSGVGEEVGWLARARQELLIEGKFRGADVVDDGLGSGVGGDCGVGEEGL